jgi:hypothetical protein
MRGAYHLNRHLFFFSSYAVQEGGEDEFELDEKWIKEKRV